MTDFARARIDEKHAGLMTVFDRLWRTRNTALGDDTGSCLTKTPKLLLKPPEIIRMRFTLTLIAAPQKIMYLAADHFRRKRILQDVNIIYGSALPSIYGAQEYAAVLNRVLLRYGINPRFNHELIEIHPENKEAIFQLRNGPANKRVAIPYDILHLVPPQRAPDFIRESPLADTQKPGEGWVRADKYTLQHVAYPNVFALGDIAGTPNAKTGAAAARQAPVVAANLLALLNGTEPMSQYNGYIACPIVTGYGRMLLCELDYTGRPAPAIPIIDTFRERYDMWLLKKYGLRCSIGMSYFADGIYPLG
ncbi:MAG: NAD(P)/FAD-dependent oxidoreductase [Terriglobia bacterium]